jgi:hypothetical protein
MKLGRFSDLNHPKLTETSVMPMRKEQKVIACCRLDNLEENDLLNA